MIARASVYAGGNPPTHQALTPLSSLGRDPVVLAPELVTGIEAGMEVRRGSWLLQTNLFQQNLRDGITDDGTNFDYALDNGERRRSRGIEVAGEWAPTRSLTMRASHTYLSAIITANDFEGQSFEYFPLVGNRDQTVPIHTFAGVIRSSLPFRAQGLLRGRYQSRYARVPRIGFTQPAPLAV